MNPARIQRAVESLIFERWRLRTAGRSSCSGGDAQMTVHHLEQNCSAGDRVGPVYADGVALRVKAEPRKEVGRSLAPEAVVSIPLLLGPGDGPGFGSEPGADAILFRIV